MVYCVVSVSSLRMQEIKVLSTCNNVNEVMHCTINMFSLCIRAGNQWSFHVQQCYRADSRFAPSLWKTASHCNDVSHWLGGSLESTLMLYNFLIYCILYVVNEYIYVYYIYIYIYIVECLQPSYTNTCKLHLNSVTTSYHNSILAPESLIQPCSLDYSMKHNSMKLFHYSDECIQCFSIETYVCCLRPYCCLHGKSSTKILLFRSSRFQLYSKYSL